MILEIKIISPAVGMKEFGPGGSPNKFTGLDTTATTQEITTTSNYTEKSFGYLDKLQFCDPHFDKSLL